MENQSLSMVQYIFGVLVAVLVFLIKEAVTKALTGLRFRKRLAIDIKVIVDNYYEHLPTLSSQLEDLHKKVEAMEAGSELTTRVAPIWSNSYSLLDDLYKNSYQLRPDSFQEAVRFYDTVGRSDEVRRAYNEHLRDQASTQNYSLPSLQYLYSCLVSMRSDYCEMIRCGCDAQKTLAREHRFLRIDTARCSNIQNQILQKESNKSSK